MTKQEIVDKIHEDHDLFMDFMSNLSKDEFERAANQKWSAGQQLEHIYLSVKPLNQAFALPKFVLKMLFGKANRPSKNYDELVLKYQSKLESGGRAPGRFVPATVSWDQKSILLQKLSKSIERLIAHTLRYSETDLDALILPHPLLGKITVREMLYFTMYHVGHHQKSIQSEISK